jgi:hypothetical protein
MWMCERLKTSFPEINNIQVGTTISKLYWLLGLTPFLNNSLSTEDITGYYNFSGLHNGNCSDCSLICSATMQCLQTDINIPPKYQYTPARCENSENYNLNTSETQQRNCNNWNKTQILLLYTSIKIILMLDIPRYKIIG